LRRAEKREARAAELVAHWIREIELLRETRKRDATVEDFVFKQAEARRLESLAVAQQRLKDAQWAVIVRKLDAA
jgi:hypothetical protein